MRIVGINEEILKNADKNASYKIRNVHIFADVIFLWRSAGFGFPISALPMQNMDVATYNTSITVYF